MSLVDLGIVKGARSGILEQVLVAHSVRQFPHVPIAHHHVTGDALEAGGELLQHGDERVIDEDHLVLGVVDDVGELLLEQADVERVQDRADTGDREIQLEMALVVPRERPHAIALLDAEPRQCAREPVDAL